ncbi:general stress protein [Nocardia sp. NPDC057353]|uniref:general stress protein n=1 Tax=Nocardia sp. NPDC057353 TaxID=3346104 RepID=UPI0036309786
MMGTTAPQQVIASFNDYPPAQELVERLAESGFPAEEAQIVGKGLRTVEQVTGRTTAGRATAAGAAAGAWFGSLLALLAVVLADAAWSSVVVAIPAGALWGAVAGAVGHRVTRNRRDLTGVHTLVAHSYDVRVPADRADEVTRCLRPAE